MDIEQKPLRHNDSISQEFAPGVALNNRSTGTPGGQGYLTVDRRDENERNFVQ
jgi:hypothetical protein